MQALSDRLAVIYEGSFVDTVDPDEVTEEELGLLMAGERPESADENGAPEATAVTDDDVTVEAADAEAADPEAADAEAADAESGGDGE